MPGTSPVHTHTHPEMLCIQPTAWYVVMYDSPPARTSIMSFVYNNDIRNNDIRNNDIRNNDIRIMTHEYNLGYAMKHKGVYI